MKFKTKLLQSIIETIYFFFPLSQTSILMCFTMKKTFSYFFLYWVFLWKIFFTSTFGVSNTRIELKNKFKRSFYYISFYCTKRRVKLVSIGVECLGRHIAPLQKISYNIYIYNIHYIYQKLFLPCYLSSQKKKNLIYLYIHIYTCSRNQFEAMSVNKILLT